MNAANPWAGINTSLAVTKVEMDSDFVNETLGFKKLALVESGPIISSGSNWWAYTFDERVSRDLDEQVASLVSQITPRLDGVKKLQDAGYAVQVAIAGTVDTGDQLCVSPRIIGMLATLGIATSFTTLTTSGTREEDPLSWLD
ncbi:DUF4279 domain-containing protein [Streptomyces lunaelactis]|uniref:DUF4279 domain-containing protein n=1 Tax=Streptomyces lunaelactis TaxID=1535768 RepID=UPI001584D14A|nr:DUF4279 domain-containing protein [Streptomyces lunaelactis]NUK05790.1 DUF4279 domain-containing protein [Streptomyces lunaelactis]NUK20291.1 DUF4279 domain-containing protein [Streptomyces lunaelactis]